MPSMNLGPGAEFDLIRELRDRWGELAPQIGDDASVVRPPRGEQLVISTDTAIEKIHFRRDWLTATEIGYRAVTAALSDLAAMAASPLGVLVAIETNAPDELMELGDGIADAVRAVGTVILGGNLSRGADLSITTTVVGSAFTPLGRKGARPGDLLYVTGALGGPNAATRTFSKKKKPGSELRDRFARPSARIAEARWLAARGAVAAIDISDGLSADAGHLAAASNVGLEIQIDRIPIFEGATRDDALAGGEEYELLLAARAPFPEDEFVEHFGGRILLTLIGRAVDGEPHVNFSLNGKRVAAPKGYDHFSR